MLINYLKNKEIIKDKEEKLVKYSEDYLSLTSKYPRQIILEIEAIDFSVIEKVKDLKLLGIYLKEKDVAKVSDLIEYLKEDIVVFGEFSFEKVAKILEERGTYQGFRRSILNEVHWQIIKNVQEDDYVIDATIGNGYDTLFLAKLVTKGKVFGFDIQKEALESTQKKVQDYPQVSLYLKSHEYINELKLDQKIKLILFNLGYLPGQNKKITTKWESTIKAIQNSLEVLRDDGLILVVVYPGHEEGLKESKNIMQYLKINHFNYQIKRNTDNPIAPYLIIIYKKNK